MDYKKPTEEEKAEEERDRRSLFMGFVLQGLTSNSEAHYGTDGSMESNERLAKQARLIADAAVREFNKSR